MFRSLIVGSLALALFVGCGESNPPTEKVTGTVTLDGTPVEGATVTFVPDDPAIRPATGKTGADGTYTLTSFVAGDGAMAGSYKIKVTKFPSSAAPEPAPTAPAKDMSIEDQYAAFEQGYTADDAGPKGKVGPEKNMLPAKYENAATSGLTATVGAGENNVPIELKKNAK